MMIFTLDRACYLGNHPLWCKTGSCKNDKTSTGCQNDFEDMQCWLQKGEVCYKEQQQPFGANKVK